MDATAAAAQWARDFGGLELSEADAREVDETVGIIVELAQAGRISLRCATWMIRKLAEEKAEGTVRRQGGR